MNKTQRLAGAAGCMAAGGAIVVVGGHLFIEGGTAVNGSATTDSQTWNGFFLVLLGLALFLLPAFLAVKTVFMKRLRAYQAWKATLTPAERGAVDAAEIAALWAGSIALHEGLKNHNDHAMAKIAAQRASMRRAANLRPGGTWQG